MAYDKVVDSAALDQKLTDIADAIRLKTDSATPIALEDMPLAISLIESGGGGEGGDEMQFVEEFVLQEDAHDINRVRAYTGRGYRKMQVEVVWAGTAQNTTEQSATITFKNGNSNLSYASIKWVMSPPGNKYSMLRLELPKNPAVRTSLLTVSNMSESALYSVALTRDVDEVDGFSFWNNNAWAGAGTRVFVYASK